MCVCLYFLKTEIHFLRKKQMNSNSLNPYQRFLWSPTAVVKETLTIVWVQNTPRYGQNWCASDFPWQITSVFSQTSSAHTKKKKKKGIYEVELLSNRSQEEHILTKICFVLVFVSESKLYQYRGSNSSSSYQLCKKITVSKHFTQHTLYSPDTSFKNMTICANELSCSSSCQRIRERNTPPCFLSFFLCKSISSLCHSLYMSKYHPCDYSSYAILPSYTVYQEQ